MIKLCYLYEIKHIAGTGLHCYRSKRSCEAIEFCMYVSPGDQKSQVSRLQQLELCTMTGTAPADCRLTPTE
jgi:hypothetical protein